MAVTDTTAAALAVFLRVQRALSDEHRLLTAFEMSAFARELSRERIRREHPEWSEGELGPELLRLAFLPAALPAALQ